MMVQIQQDKDRLNLGPKKFVMWLFVFASFMIFAAWTSGFIVYAGGKGHALNVILPNIFIYSTSVIALSSVTLISGCAPPNAWRCKNSVCSYC